MSSRNLVLVAIAVLALATPAAAQEPATETAPVAEAPPVVESANAAEARISVARAKALFAIGDHSAALAEFTRAYELLQGDPRQADVLNNIAVCHERLFRYDLALAYYDRYLRESTTATAEDRADVEAVMGSLRDLLGTVRITGVSQGEIWLDDRKLGDVTLELLVPAGLHVIEIRARGYQSERRELRVSARAVHDIHVELERIDRGLPSTYFWVGAALTGAALITGSAFGIAALSEDEDGERDARRGLRVEGQDARDLALQADIAFGAAIAFGVGTAVLSFLTDWDGQPEAERNRTTALRFGLTNDAVVLSLKGVTP